MKNKTYNTLLTVSCVYMALYVIVIILKVIGIYNISSDALGIIAIFPTIVLMIVVIWRLLK